MTRLESLISSFKEQILGEKYWQLFARITLYTSRYNRLLLISLLLLFPLAIANALQPVLIGQAISLIRQEPTTYHFLENLSLSKSLHLLEFLLALTVLVRLLLSGLQGYLIQRVGQEITADIRNNLFEHIISLSMHFFNRTSIGKLITRLTSDVEALGEVFTTEVTSIISDLFLMITIFVLMFQQKWQLALILFLLLLPVSGLVVYFQRKYRKANYQSREELSALNSNLQENILGINIVQMFRREQFNAELFRAINHRYTNEMVKTIIHESAVSSTLEWTASVAIASILWLGSSLVLQGQLSFGTLTTFILFAQRLFDPLQRFAEKFISIQSGFTAIERVNDILDEPLEISDVDSPASLSNNQCLIAGTDITRMTRIGEIRFEHVWFAYQKDDYILKDLDFIIHPNEKVALVGPTGAGKSSIIRLLCRLYEPNQGRILVDGLDIRELPQPELRHRVGIILQEGFLFAGDVKSNIALGDVYTIDEIRAAAKKTNVFQFIEQFPQSFNTKLRGEGINLSSGQKQLLAFARVMIRDPNILVLDEATASLDVRTEALIQNALETLLVNRTAIIIAHRLSTIRDIDRILVLKKGQILESGSHIELLKRGGLYTKLYNLQMLGV